MGESSLTRWLIYHVASGHVFFTGVALLLIAVGLSATLTAPRSRAPRMILAFAGVALIAVSSTPLSVLVYSLFAGTVLLWLVGEAWPQRFSPSAVFKLRIAATIACLAATALELPYHFTPTLPPLGRPTLSIVADSISAGMGEYGKPTWPNVFAERYGPVRDRSVAGANVESALPQATAAGADERLMLLEIGGNDFLGSTSPADFEIGLEALLTAACRPGRVVVMLELPLPPGCVQYGMIQRTLAQRHGVYLIPKRILMGVLRPEAATVDSIHLSRLGHRQMADAMWEVLQSAYRDEPHADATGER